MIISVPLPLVTGMQWILCLVLVLTLEMEQWKSKSEMSCWQRGKIKEWFEKRFELCGYKWHQLT